MDIQYILVTSVVPLLQRNELNGKGNSPRCNADHQDTMNDMVQLNVGGTVFATSRATLSRYEDSMLGKMFNGTWTLNTDPEGRCFIDRDGSLFRHVLNFLRTGLLLIPDEFSELQLLRCEADFYQIAPLVEAVDRETQRREQLTMCNQDYYLDIAGVNTFAVSGRPCRKALIIVGYLDVIKSLPLDANILTKILSLKHFHDTNNKADIDVCEQHSIDNWCKIQWYTDGELYHVLATAYFNESGVLPKKFGFRINQSDLADILLANNCSLISSSSALHKNYPADTYEFHCCDKWRIPVKSLELLSRVPKL